MFLGSCSQCCGCDSQTLNFQSLSNANGMARPLNSAGPDWKLRELSIGTVGGQNAFDYYTLSWNALSGEIPPDAVRGAAFRLMAGYDDATGNHAFLEYETHCVRVNNSLSLPAGSFFYLSDAYWAQSITLNSYTNPNAQYAVAEYLAPENRSLTYNLAYTYSYASQVNSGTPQFRWAANYSFVCFRAGYQIGGSQTILGEWTIPSLQTMSYWLGCQGNLFSVMFLQESNTFPLIDRLAGNRAFGGSFSLPSELQGADRGAGYSVRPPRKTSPAAFGVFGTVERTLQSSAEAQFPSTTPTPEIKVSVPGAVTFYKTRDLYRLPCGETISGTVDGYSGLTLPQGSNTTQASCRFYVRDPTRGQHAAPVADPVTAALFSCSSNAQTLRLTLTLTRNGVQYNSPESLFAAEGYNAGRLTAILAAAAVAGTHTLTRVPGNSAAWAMSIAGMEASITYDVYVPQAGTRTESRQWLDGVLYVEQRSYLQFDYIGTLLAKVEGNSLFSFPVGSLNDQAIGWFGGPPGLTFLSYLTLEYSL